MGLNSESEGETSKGMEVLVKQLPVVLVVEKRLVQEENLAWEGHLLELGAREWWMAVD